MKKKNKLRSKSQNYENDFVENILDENEGHKIEEKGKKRMDVGGKAKVLDQPKLDLGKTIPAQQIEEIIKTTDSMQMVSRSFKQTEETDSRRLQEASRAILKSYDLAIRKIKATYQDILDTKKSISNEFLTVQILIKKYEEFSDIKQIANVINLFSDEVETLLSYGKGVWFSNDLVLEAADYINKMIPIARIITPDTIIVNMLKWFEVADNLVRQNKITISEKSIIEALVGALNQNLKNGYYIKLGNLIISRIRPTDPECMILFSGETILRMNRIYSGERSSRNKQAINKLNYLNKFMSNVALQKEKDQKALKKIDLAIKHQDLKEKQSYQEIREREENATLSKEDISEKYDVENFEDDLIQGEEIKPGVFVIDETSDKSFSKKEEPETNEKEVREEKTKKKSKKDAKKDAKKDEKVEMAELEQLEELEEKEDKKEDKLINDSEDKSKSKIKAKEENTKDEMADHFPDFPESSDDKENIDSSEEKSHVENYVDPKDKKAVKAAKKAEKKKAKLDKKKKKGSFEDMMMDHDAELNSENDNFFEEKPDDKPEEDLAANEDIKNEDVISNPLGTEEVLIKPKNKKTTHKPPSKKKTPTKKVTAKKPGAPKKATIKRKSPGRR